MFDNSFRKFCNKIDYGKTGHNQFTHDIIQETAEINSSVNLQLKHDQRDFNRRRNLMKFQVPKNFLAHLNQVEGE